MKMSVTVVIPFMKVDEFLFHSVSSVVSQSYPIDVIELICDSHLHVGDLERIEDYCAKSNIVLHYDSNNMGLATRLNQSIIRCNTDLYFRMDADDICLPDRLKKQVAIFECYDVDMVCTGAEFINREGELIGTSNFFSCNLQSSNILPFENIIIHPSVAFNTKWIKSHLYDASFLRSQDKELWLRTYANSNFYLLAEPLLQYRVTNDTDYDRKLFNYLWSFRSSKKHIGKFGFSIWRNLIKNSSQILYYWTKKHVKNITNF